MSIPSNYTFVATYANTIDAQRGSGVLIGTSVNGASIIDETLDLTFNDIRYVTYQGAGNVNNPQTGAVKFMLTPNYTGSPPSIRVFWSMMAAPASLINLIQFYHLADGTLNIYISDSAGALICTGAYGTWSPVAGTSYEIEVDYDITLGINRLFIDGALFGSITGTGTRSTNINTFNVGTGFSAIHSSDFSISNLIVFNTVQHTAAYTPGYCLGWAEETVPGQCLVYGFLVKDTYVSLPNATITVTANKLYEYGNLQVYGPVGITQSNNTGYWEINLIESISYNVSYTFTFTYLGQVIKEYVGIIVPNQMCVSFSELVD